MDLANRRGLRRELGGQRIDAFWAAEAADSELETAQFAEASFDAVSRSWSSVCGCRLISVLIASRAAMRPLSSASTVSAIGMSTP